MINTKQDLKKYLNEELKNYKTTFLKRIFNIGEASILYKHQKTLRIAEYYTNINNKLMSTYYRFKLSKIQNKYSIHVPINTCGIGLRIMHVAPILINQKAKIGKNCVLHANTSIVAGGRDNGVPTIKDNVIIGIGAIILGNITIESDVAVGANAVVNKNVTEKNIAVAGIPAKKISNNGRNTWNKK